MTNRSATVRPRPHVLRGRAFPMRVSYDFVAPNRVALTIDLFDEEHGRALVNIHVEGETVPTLYARLQRSFTHREGRQYRCSLTRARQTAAPHWSEIDGCGTWKLLQFGTWKPLRDMISRI